MCRHYGISVKEFNRRIAYGWTVERALAPEKQNKQPCTGPDGSRYPSVEAMCRAHGVDRTTYERRRKNGLALEECLRPTRKPATDHLGTRWPSMTAMCRHWGVDRHAYVKRVDSGWAVGDALTAQRSGAPITGPDGRPYRSMSELCRSLHVKLPTVSSRMHVNGEDAATAARKACESTWPGTDAGSYAIEKCVQWPWFLCRDEYGSAVILGAAQICGLKGGNGKTGRQ